MIWIYFVLIFQCIHLIPGKSSAGHVTGFLCTHLNPSNSLHKGRLMVVFYTTLLINLVFFEK